MEDRYLAIALRHSDYVVACLSIGSLEGRWSTSEEQADWPILRFTAGGWDDVNDRNEIFGSVLKLRDNFEDGDPWIAAVSAIPQTWRLGRRRTEMVIVTFVPQNGRGGKNYFSTTRVHLEEDGQGSQHPRKRSWKLTVAAQSTTPCRDLPWYPQNVSYSGRMIAVWGNTLNVYDLSSSKEQPGKVIRVPTLRGSPELTDGFTINTVEPWSESVTLGLAGSVSVINLRCVGSKSDR